MRTNCGFLVEATFDRSRVCARIRVEHKEVGRGAKPDSLHLLHCSVMNRAVLSVFIDPKVFYTASTIKKCTKPFMVNQAGAGEGAVTRMVALRRFPIRSYPALVRFLTAIRGKNA